MNDEPDTEVSLFEKAVDYEYTYDPDAPENDLELLTLLQKLRKENKTKRSCTHEQR
jgi:hypothetical protein